MTEMYEGADDGFHEIQLSGKQLVFLFMATTVVSVVIFLCGVLVGRGVRGDTVNAAEKAVATPAAAPAPSSASPANAPAADPATTAAKDPYSYPGRLEGEKPPTETVRAGTGARPAPEEPKPAAPASATTTPPATAPPAAASPAVPAPPAAVTPATTPAAPQPAPAATARSGTWAVQVVALTDRAAATAVVQRLSGKGYPAFLVTPQAGASTQNYKVQVGRYNDRAEAEQIKLRLKKEEQFEPWILR